MDKQLWICPKCGNTKCEIDEFRATGSGFSRMFDVQNKKFTTVSCTQCGFTELYKRPSSALGNIFDFLVG